MATAAKSYAQTYLDANPDVKAEYERFKADDPKKWTPENYVAYHYYNYGAGEDRPGSEFFKQNTDKLAGQILAQGTSGKWAGQGHGSAEANARDMGKILASAGITDISQFGMVPKYLSEGRLFKPAKDVVVQTGSDGRPVYGTLLKEMSGSGEDAEYTETFQPLADQSKVIFRDGVPDVVIGQTYGNKVTGQPIQNTYAERQTGNAWGGTFAGEGNTGYRVQFDAQGNPIFYTTGASSNDLANMLDDPILGALAQAGAAYFGGPMGTAALNAAMGKDLKDVAKATALSYIGGQAANTVSGSLAGTLGQTGANIAGNVARSVVTGGDPVQALITGGIGAALPEITSQIPGFDTFGPATQKAINNTVASAIASGGDISPDMLVRAGLTAAKDYVSTGGPNPKDFEPGSYEYNQIFNPNTAGSVDLSERPYDPDYKPTTDFSIGADYSLAPKENGLGFKVTAPPEVFNPDGSINYDLFDYEALSKLGMDMPKSPNIDGMGGGQGLRIPVEGGYITEAGFIPEGYTPNLGDPNSFINKPPPGGDVSIKGALNAGAKATLADLNKKPSAPGTAKPPAKPGTPSSGMDINQLAALLNNQQAAPTIVSSGQDNSADVQLMEDIFGTSLSAPPAGDSVTQARELARLLRS
jgi:hypothetical protein